MNTQVTAYIRHINVPFYKLIILNPFVLYFKWVLTMKDRCQG